MKKIYKLGLSLGATLSVVAPISTAVACEPKGGDNVIIDNGNKKHDRKTTMTLSDVPISEYDVERNILNTSAFGILPLSRIQHEFEAKDNYRNLTDINQVSTKLAGFVNATMIKHLADDDQELIEHAKIFIDDSINGLNGAKQSLTNPIKKFSITKKQIINNSKASYENIATQINDFLTQNPNNQYSIFTHLAINDAETENGFTDGAYEVRIYQKKNNSQDLQKAIDLFKDTNKFGSDIFALNNLNGFTFTTVAMMQDTLSNWSIYSNYLQNEQTHSARWGGNPEKRPVDDIAKAEKDFKTGTHPRVFQFDQLTDSAKAEFDIPFTTTAGASGSSMFEFGSQKGILDTDLDFLDNHVAEVGNLILDKKTNVINLELTVTTVDNAKDYRENGSKTAAERNVNYEGGSVATIAIPLPLHTSWKATAPSATAKDDLISNIKRLYKFDTLYSGFLNLIQSAQELKDDVFDAQSLVTPHLKMLLLDDLSLIDSGAKYSQLVQDQDFLSKFIDWEKTKNSAFDDTTFNQILNSFPEFPKTLGAELNSSQLYSFFAYFQIFYSGLEQFVNTDGASYKNQLVASSAQEQLINANNKTFTEQITKLKTDFFDKNKTVTLDNVLFSTIDQDKASILALAKVPDVGINNWPYEALKTEVSGLIMNNDGTATAEITVSAIIPTNVPIEKFNITLTGVLGAKEIKTITDSLNTELAQHNLTNTNYDVKGLDNIGATKGGFQTNLLKLIAKPKPTSIIANDLSLSSNDFKYLLITPASDPLFGKPTFEKYDDFIKANPLPQGMEWAFKVQNLDVADAAHPKWDLLVGLKDTKSTITTFGAQTLKIEVK